MKPNISFVPGSLTIVKFKVSGFGLTIPNANAGTEVSLNKSDQIKHLLIDHFPMFHTTLLLACLLYVVEYVSDGNAYQQTNHCGQK